jgi:dephospho-CoA kinase
MRFDNAYFIIGSAYAGKSTMVKLLAEKYNGILCEENYHDQLLPELDSTEFPFLTYTRDLEDWHDFIRRTPEEYKAWMDGVSRECEILELRLLDGLKDQGRPVFVDTNISIETLKSITPEDHVLVMLADPQISVRRFFERPDREKQFLYRLIMDEPDPEKAMENYRKGLMLINSQENYDRYLHSGFHVIIRNENRSIEQTLEMVEKAFGLQVVQSKSS